MQIWRAPGVDDDSGGGRSGVADRRVFNDSEGRGWVVRERDVGRTADGMPRRSLIFETDGVLRRVYDYPRDWRSLSDAMLERLSWGR